MKGKDKDIVLFGCGQVGFEVLNLLGEENVLCFCDNNQSLQGTKRWDQEVISLKQLKQDYDDFTIIICINPNKAFNIIKQLDEEGINDYWLYLEIKDTIFSMKKDEILLFLKDEKKMFHMRMEYYQNKISELTCQLDYMKKHADIKSLSPAVGKLRERQLALVDLGEFFSYAVEPLGVRPFLCGGNLLGYIRHNGFIPWDDDMDFELIRKDYERLYQYCMEEKDNDDIVTFKYNGRIERLRFINGFGLLKLVKELNDKPDLELDFFVLDYYDDNFKFDNLRKEVKRIYESVYGLSSKDKIRIVRDEMKKNKFVVEKSNTIFYGIDNQESVRLYDKGKMMSENTVFPLKRVTWEGAKYWIPNKPEEFLSYAIDNIWEFPSDIGIHKHTLISEN